MADPTEAAIGDFDFDELNKLRLYLDEQLVRATPTLRNYYNPRSQGFIHVQRETPLPRNAISMASTATCVAFLVDSGRWDSEGAPWEGTVERLIEQIIQSRWDSAELGPGNPFTTSFLLEAIADLTGGMARRLSSVHRPEVRQQLTALERLLRQGRGVAVSKYPPNSFLTYKAVRALRQWNRLSDEVAEVTAEWAWRQLFEESVLVDANHGDSDVFELAYAALTVSLCHRIGEMEPRQREALDHALNLVMDRQNERGLWRRSRPLFLYPNLGNAYCYDYELLTSMLRDEQLTPILGRRFPSLARSAYALEKTKVPLQAQSSDALPDEPEAVGWSSGHLPQEVTLPESWSTASVFHYCHRLQRLVVEAIRRDLFAYAAELYRPPDRGDEVVDIDSSRFLDSEFVYGDRRRRRSLTRVLRTEFLRPLARSRDFIRRGQPFPPGVPCSAILFGPPGTSKTELARLTAAYLGWPLLTLDPSNLTRRGLEQLHAEAHRLFTMLEAAEEIVVLFDEFDELVRERDEAGSDAASRFLTTAMLPKLTALSNRRRIVYLLATNHLERFDTAVRRPGRFDRILPVMPPTLESKLNRWPEVTRALRDFGIRNRTDEERAIRSALADLTFLEFADLVPRLTGARSRRRAVQLINEAAERCILNQEIPVAHLPVRYEADYAAQAVTWRQRMQDEAGKVRL